MSPAPANSIVEDFRAREAQGMIKLVNRSPRQLRSASRAGRLQILRIARKFTRRLGRATVRDNYGNMKDFRTWVKSWNIQPD
jgi:hypothetical protein